MIGDALGPAYDFLPPFQRKLNLLLMIRPDKLPVVQEVCSVFNSLHCISCRCLRYVVMVYLYKKLKCCASAPV
jgi:hypothetical protein